MISAPIASAISSPISSRAGWTTGRDGVAGSITAAASSASRAVSTAAAGTITSRGPAASMSGTSNPAVRRNMLGTPCSSSSPWMNSPSAWLRTHATFTG